MDKEKARELLEEAIIKYAQAYEDPSSRRTLLNNWVEISLLIDAFACECERKTEMASEAPKTAQEPSRAIGLPNPGATSGNISEAYLTSPYDPTVLYNVIERVGQSQAEVYPYDSYKMLDFQCPTELMPHSKMLVAGFASAMAYKMLKAQNKYGYTDLWKATDWASECVEELHDHVKKGDVRDIAIYSAFMWYHGWKP